MNRYASQNEYNILNFIQTVHKMIAENLQKLRKALTFGRKEFAVKLGINPLTYANYERNERKPPYEMLIKLSDDYNVNLNWLINDKGEMFNKQQPSTSNDELEQKVVEVMKKYGVIEHGVGARGAK